MKTITVAIILLFNISTYAKEPLIVAHRGASRDAPENTIPAFKLAWEQGADAIEGDYHITKDGHIVCIHDDNTKRVSKTNMVVRNSTLEELRGLDLGSPHGEAFKGTVIPTIDEVFSTIPDQKTIYIEIKCGVEIVPPLIEAIKKSGLKQEQIVVICFNTKVIQELKAKDPQYKAYWLCSFKKNKDGGMTPSLETAMKTLDQIQADGLSSDTAIPEPFIETIEKKGYEWHVWTIDDLKAAKHAKAMGAKSITTNVPRVIREHLVEQGAP
jgi:glycerophosphoryl diester phosphodiesterase